MKYFWIGWAVVSVTGVIGAGYYSNLRDERAYQLKMEEIRHRPCLEVKP